MCGHDIHSWNHLYAPHILLLSVCRTSVSLDIDGFSIWLHMCAKILWWTCVRTDICVWHRKYQAMYESWSFLYTWLRQSSSSILSMGSILETVWSPFPFPVSDAISCKNNDWPLWKTHYVHVAPGQVMLGVKSYSLCQLQIIKSDLSLHSNSVTVMTFDETASRWREPYLI